MSVLDKFSSIELGSRLKIARNSARVTQEEAASAIGLGRTTIISIESGERQVRPSELTKLAELYKVSVNSLLREDAVHFDLIPQFRRSLSAREDEKASLEAVNVLQRLASMSVELERVLGKKWKSISFPEYRILRSGWQEQAEDLAMEVRQRLGIGSGPIADIFTLIEADLGVRLFIHRLPSKISGVFAYQAEIGPCILLNSVHPPERRSWTCAHEVAHFLTNRLAADIAWVDSHDRNLEERFADRFAAAFLMPGSMARLRFSEIAGESNRFSPRNLIFLARSFNVSVEAMGRRLEQLGLLLAGTYDSLVERGFSVKIANELFGLHASASSSFIPRLTWLALEAYQMSYLTEGQVADMLGSDRITIRRLSESLLASDVEYKEQQNG